MTDAECKLSKWAVEKPKREPNRSSSYLHKLQIQSYTKLKKTKLNQNELPNLKNKLKQIWSKTNVRRTAKLLKFKSNKSLIVQIRTETKASLIRTENGTKPNQIKQTETEPNWSCPNQKI